MSLPIEIRKPYVDDGFIRSAVTDDGTLAIYTYTDSCTFARKWDEVTMNSRGHVFNIQTGECVARPFAKFFNLGENEMSLVSCFDWNQPYECYEKIDGWMSSLLRHNGRFEIATRGSFHSTGAVWATNFIQTKDLSFLPDEVTLVFELINPEHKIILDYEGMSTLVILAAFNRLTGKEYSREIVENWAKKADLPIVKKYGMLTLAEMQKIQKERENFEGFVIRFADGKRVKIKTEWYLARAKIMAHLSPISIWDIMVEGKVPQEYLDSIPEELRPIAEGYATYLEGAFADVHSQMTSFAQGIIDLIGKDRKSLALHMQSIKAPSVIRGVVFSLLDGKSITDKVMEKIYPKGNVMEYKKIV
jgi:RNA ligase